MAAYFFASPIDVDIKMEGEEQRKQVEMKSDKEKTISCPVYYDGDSVSGTVRAQYLCCTGTRSLRRCQYGYGTGRRCSMTGSRSSLWAA
jgi:hypothetical protein